MEELDLEELRKVAEQATPGPWSTVEANVVQVPNFPDGLWVVDCPNPSEVDHVNAEYIATFDPPTVLALLTQLEQAEKNATDNDRLADELLTDRDYWEAKLTNLVYSLATEEEVGEWSSMNDIADNLIEHIGGKLQKLEQAEAQVARVRGLSAYLKKLAPGDGHYAQLIEDALANEN